MLYDFRCFDPKLVEGLRAIEDTEWEAEAGGESRPESCEPDPAEGEPGADGVTWLAPSLLGILGAGDICGFQNKWHRVTWWRRHRHLPWLRSYLQQAWLYQSLLELTMSLMSYYYERLGSPAGVFCFLTFLAGELSGVFG